MEKKYSLGVAGVVMREDTVLMVRRMHEPYKGRWTIPGGYVEGAEPVDVAIRREISEETGVLTEPIGVIGVRHRISSEDSNLVVIFLMKVIEGDPCPDGTEVDRAQYFPVQEALESPEVIQMSRLAIVGMMEAQGSALVQRYCEPTPLIGTTTYLLYCLGRVEGE